MAITFLVEFMFLMIAMAGVNPLTFFCCCCTTLHRLFENGALALKGCYLICGYHAYKVLPPNWTGLCYIGVVHPLFFLLPGGNDNQLGIKIYADLI